MNKKKIVILGATGFIGFHLCKFLVDKGFYIIVLVRSKNNLKLKRLNQNKITVVPVGDLNVIRLFPYNFNDIDCVINCAAKAHISKKIRINHNEYIKKLTNIERNIIKNIKNKNLRIIHLSSAKVSNILKNNENHKIDIYTKAKLLSEELIASYYKNYVILRPPIVYGPGVGANFLKLMNLINLNLPLPFLNINNARSYLYVGNLLDVILKILSRKDIKKKIYYVCDGQNLSTYKLCKIISKYLSKKIFFFYLNKNLLNIIFRILNKESILDKLIGDFEVGNKKISEDLDWKPKYKIEQGIKKTCFWYKRRFNIRER